MTTSDFRFKAHRKEYELAFICPRKLSLHLRGLRTDVYGRKPPTRPDISPNILGVVGESAVHSALTGGLPYIGPEPEIPREISDFVIIEPTMRKYDLSVIPTDEWKSIEKKRNALYVAGFGLEFESFILDRVDSIVSILDSQLPDIPKQPPVEIQAEVIPSYLQELRQTYGIRDVFRQVSFQSDGLLIRGRIDHLALTESGVPLIIEAKNTRSHSWTDRFQIEMYIAAIRSGAKLTGGRKASIEDSERDVLASQLRVYNDFRRLIYEYYWTNLLSHLEKNLELYLKQKQFLNLDESLESILWTSNDWNGLLLVRYESLFRQILQSSQKQKELESLIAPLSSRKFQIDRWMWSEVKALEKIWHECDTGLLIYHKQEESHEIEKGEHDFDSIVKTRWGVAALNTKSAFPVIPDGAPCSRCKFRRACEKAPEGKSININTAPLPILYEIVDTALSSSEVLENKETRQLAKTVPKLEKEVKEAIHEDAPALRLRTHLTLPRPDIADSQWIPYSERTHFLWKYRNELENIEAEVLKAKVLTSIEENDHLGKHFMNWRKSNALKLVHGYVGLSDSDRVGLNARVTSYWDISI